MSHLGNRVKMGYLKKIDHTCKNVWHLEKLLLAGRMSETLKNGLPPGSNRAPKGSPFKKMHRIFFPLNWTDSHFDNICWVETKYLC